jgi:hypothetical protein
MKASEGPSHACPRPSPRRPAGFLRWKESLRDVPDLRWDKIQRIREAIRLRSYDEEILIERLLDRFENEMGVLCRRERGGR